MDENTFARLSEVNDALVEYLRWLLEKRDLEALTRLIPIVDKLTTALIQESRDRSSLR